MVSFLFWNINKKPLTKVIVQLALNYNLDIIMLAECNIEPTELLLKLNEKSTNYHYIPQIGCERIEIYSKFPFNFIEPIQETNHTTIRRLRIPKIEEILLVVTHLTSKRNYTEADQAGECRRLVETIQYAEQKLGHRRTVVVGDLNMNPFEDGLMVADGLHAVMAKNIARKEYRTIQDKQYFYFYNPMWGLFGDTTPGPAGTYYYQQSNYKAYHWHIFDQVLVRPALIDSLSDLEIVKTDGVISLTDTQGLPNKNKFSDHLPIYFQLKI